MKEGLKLLRPECIFERNRKNKGNSMKNEFWNEGIDSGKNPENNSKIESEVKKEVIALCSKFPIYNHLIKN